MTPINSGAGDYNQGLSLLQTPQSLLCTDSQVTHLPQYSQSNSNYYLSTVTGMPINNLPTAQTATLVQPSLNRQVSLSQIGSYNNNFIPNANNMNNAEDYQKMNANINVMTGQEPGQGNSENLAQLSRQASSMSNGSDYQNVYHNVQTHQIYPNENSQVSYMSSQV